LNVSYVRDDSVHVSQLPGGANVLGRLHFNFPNRFLVYQHNTNERFMFTHEVRAYSRGCMRVQDPAKYAEVLLNIARPSEHWTVEKVTQMFGGAEQDIQLQPWLGHDWHFHVRLDCPPDSPECEGQPPRPEGDGCHSEEMDRWSNNIVLEHSMPRAGPKMSNLPAACWGVLNAP
jgi:hypothetical protein